MSAKLELAWWRLGKIPEGTRFRDYVLKHVSEQYGLSKTLARSAAKHLAEATRLREALTVVLEWLSQLCAMRRGVIPGRSGRPENP